MTGGEISGNTAGGSGDGVFVNGIFTMSASAVVKQEVHIEVGKQIAVSGVLAPPEGETYSAQISLAVPSDDAVVLEGAGGYSLTESDAAKFKLLNSNFYLSYQNGNGVLINAPTLAAAISGIGAGTTAVVYIAQDEITVASSINVYGNVTLAVMDGLEATVKRGSGFTDGSLFTVQSGASLVLDAGNGSLTLDGGSQTGITADAPLVTVSGGTLTMNDGVTLQNNDNGGDHTECGGVSVKSGGIFMMSGGNISNNNGFDGGGVFVEGSRFEMSGGTISGNISAANGGGLHLRDSGTFKMTGGEISGNKVISTGWGNGGGVYQVGSMFEMSGGVIYGNEEAVDESLRNTASNNGAAFYSDGGGTFNPSTLHTSDYTINAGVITGP
jgi:hypothetical protein